MSQTNYDHAGTTNDCPTVPLPAGIVAAKGWQDSGLRELPYRVIFGAHRDVTDHKARVYTSAIQFADGRIDDGLIEAPSLAVSDADSLTSDQARELAALLLEAADELDGWTR